ncbi:uncharacterized protein [Montipora capricornis]|uniref:uncharacterized protein n=1 Tax=Montipora capricornis TaxID=246305 RepID=UPI0035F21AE7
MDASKNNSTEKGRKIFTQRRKEQRSRNFNFPAMAKLNQEKTNAESLPPPNQSKFSQLKTSLQLPRINLNRTFSLCKRSFSHNNLYGKSTIRSLPRVETSPLNSICTQEINVMSEAAKVKISRSHTDLTATQKLLKSLRVVDLQITENRTKIQEEKSLNICRMKLTPRQPRPPEKGIILGHKLERNKLQVIYPTLRLTSTDRKAIFTTSPSLSWSSMESLDSILGDGTLTLSQLPPDILSSCSPSEYEFTPPSTPIG